MMMKQKTGKRSRKDDHTWIYTAWMGSFGTFVLIGTATLHCFELQRVPEFNHKAMQSCSLIQIIGYVRIPL